jgi:CheY-like chemotaxis protein/PAS domain-containing protein
MIMMLPELRGRVKGGRFVTERPRILCVEGDGRDTAADLARDLSGWDVVPQADLAAGLHRLRHEPFAGVFIDTRSDALRSEADHLLQADHVLENLQDGVAILDDNLTVLWTNPAFRALADGAVVGRSLQEVLRCTETLAADAGAFAAARSGQIGTARLPCDPGRWLEVRVIPAPDGDGRAGPRFIAQFRDVTREEERQQKLDALHHAGRALSDLEPDQLADMCVEERVELLKHNIRQFIHELLHYDVIEIRLLNKLTGRLDPLLADGMTPEAARRVLYAKAEGNGVTGLVAATGKSYLCPDTAHDPHYIEGAAGARSSLTVPLMVGDEVIGTFNVESPRLNAFTVQDLQFAEIFSREIAHALNTLELLSAQTRCTATASVDAVSREVALPADDILAATTALLARPGGHDPETVEKLKVILAGVRSIKQCIQKVGETLAPAAPAGRADSIDAKLKGLRVLVVDADERVRRTAHGLLGRFGCQVETARGGHEALAMANAGSYDVILVDIRLPDLSGYEAYRRLREAQPQARMVLMSAFGYDASHSIVKARQDGLRFVLYKPFRTDQLLDALVSPPPAPVGSPPPSPQAVGT